MIKIVTLFLVGVAVLAMLGRLKLRLPGPGRRPPKEIARAKLCPDCGRLLIGTDSCDCGAPPGRKG